MIDDEILDDLFHGCALAAFVEQARLQQGWPDCELTRQRAYRSFEEGLRAKTPVARAPGPDPLDQDRSG